MVGQTSQPGSYALTLSGGTQQTLAIRGETRSHAIEGPWETAREQDGGFTRVRQSEFALPADFGQGQRVVLDLGDVQGRGDREIVFLNFIHPRRKVGGIFPAAHRPCVGGGKR